MDIFDQILENLELERDLGTRTVEIDRALLVPPSVERPVESAPRTAEPVVEKKPRPVRTDTPQVPVSPAPETSPLSAPPSRTESAVPPACDVDIAFFTGRALSPEGEDAMAKTFAAIRKIKPDARLCINEERKAKVCVLLGSDALVKRIPAARPVRGKWVTAGGVPTVMTFSPDYIFSHFQKDSPNMVKAKLEMWNDIKLAVARI